MKLQSTSALTDICTLAEIARRDTYAGALYEEIRRVTPLTPDEMEDTLHRLHTRGFLECYDWPADGENRLFYRLTGLGRCLLEQSLSEWDSYKRRIDNFLTDKSGVM